jgi:transcription-repair coupling factor (superfamily II helicase)
LSLAIAEAASSAKRFTLLLTADSQSAERLEQELSFFAPQLPVLHFPDWETLPYDLFSPHQDIISQRISALYRLPELKHGVLVVPITTALHRLPPKRFLLGSSLVLQVGQQVDVNQMRGNLEAAGYRCVDTVYEHGEFAVRGALIDLFPMGSRTPFRIDLFDDEIETLRTFDPESQRSIDKVDSIKLLPAREFPLEKKAVTDFRGRFRERFDVDFRRCPIYQDLSTGITPAGIEYYLPLFFEETATLFDYLPGDTQVFSLPGIEKAAEQFWSDARNRYDERRVDPERPLLPPADIFLPVEDCFARLKNWPRVVVSQDDIATGVGHSRFNAQALPDLAIQAKANEPLAALRRFIEEYPGRVLFCAESAGRREVLLELLARLKLKPKEFDNWPAFTASKDRLGICIAPLDEGLLLEDLALIAESPLFGQRVMQRRRREKSRDGGDNVIKNLTELREGSPVVHIDHGVGRYLGLVTMEFDGQAAEFLALMYAEEAKLYVPVASLHLIARYSGSDDALAPLHRLGSQSRRASARCGRRTAGYLRPPRRPRRLCV